MPARPDPAAAPAGPGPIPRDPAPGRRLRAVAERALPGADRATVCAEFLAVLADFASAGRASLMLVNPDSGRLRVEAALGLPDGLVGHDAPARSGSIAEWVFRERRPVALEGEVRDRRFEGTNPGIGASVCLPLTCGDETLGVVNLARLRPAPAFGAGDLEALRGLLEPIGGTLARLGRVRRALESQDALARGGLASALPIGTLELPGWEIGFARTAGARDGADFADRVAHGPGENHVILVDVPGTGAAARERAAFVRGMFAAAAAPERSCAGLVARLGVGVHARFGAARFAAMWLARLKRGGELVSCRAGHAAPFRVPADGGTIGRLESGGPPAGALECWPYEEEVMRLLPGDLVVAVSDALLQSLDATGAAFGAERVTERLEETRRGPLDRLAHDLIAAAIAWTGRREPVDDLTVLALRFSPGS